MDSGKGEAMSSEWMAFLSREQMAKWLLNTDAGNRYLGWFVRKYARAIMATDAGRKIVDWIRGEIEKDDAALGWGRHKIVVERFPDGMLKVYAEKSDVTFIHRLEVNSVRGEILDDEWAELNCPHAYKGVYNGRIAGTDFYTGRTPQREAARLSRMELSAAISAGVKRREESAKNRSDSEPGTGDSSVGDDRGCADHTAEASGVERIDP